MQVMISDKQRPFMNKKEHLDICGGDEARAPFAKLEVPGVAQVECHIKRCIGKH